MERFKLYPGGGKPNHFKDLVKQMRVAMPDLIEHVKLKAELERARYDALKEVGFTTEETMEIMKCWDE